MGRKMNLNNQKRDESKQAGPRWFFRNGQQAKGNGGQ
jgi:hypothetical protein